jgi:hypothetical protein
MTSVQSHLGEEVSTVPGFSHAHIKMMIDKIHRMTEDEHHQIFHIIRQDTKKYTENQNGIFVNLAHVGNETLHKIHQFVEYWEDKRKLMSESEMVLQTIKETDPQDRDQESLNCEEVSEYINSMVVDNKVEDLYTISDLSDVEQQVATIDHQHRKRNLTLNRVKPRYEGSAARIAKKCMATSTTGFGTPSTSEAPPLSSSTH